MACKVQQPPGWEANCQFDWKDQCRLVALGEGRPHHLYADVWDVLWRQRRNVQTIGLLIADEIHLVGGEVVPTYEVVISPPPSLNMRAFGE